MRRIHFACTDSTNTQARLFAASSPGEVLLVTADEQTCGRGRQGRTWHSPRGGAWLSIAWPIAKAPQAYAAISLAAAVGVLSAIEDLAGPGFDAARIKWPNDLLIHDRKVAGILCELCPRPGGQGGCVIIGVGLNVNLDLAGLGTGLRHEPTTLSVELGRAVGVEEAVDAIGVRMLQALAEFEAQGLSTRLRERLAAHLAYVGTTRSWRLPSGVIVGRVIGIDHAGRLQMETDGGTTVLEVGEFTGDADRL